MQNCGHKLSSTTIALLDGNYLFGWWFQLSLWLTCSSKLELLVARSRAVQGTVFDYSVCSVRNSLLQEEEQDWMGNCRFPEQLVTCHTDPGDSFQGLPFLNGWILEICKCRIAFSFYWLLMGCLRAICQVKYVQTPRAFFQVGYTTYRRILFLGKNKSSSSISFWRLWESLHHPLSLSLYWFWL